MIQEKQKLFFKTIRVLLQNERLPEVADTEKHSFITIISYKPLSLGKEFDLKKKDIVNIYVNKDIKEILAGFKRTTRQEINKTYNIERLKIVADDKNFDTTYKLYKEFEYAQGRVPWGKESFENTVLFNAYFRDTLVSSISCYDTFPYFQVRAMFSKRLSAVDRKLQKIISFSTRRLVYEVCRFAHNKGFTFVGLGSVNFSDPQKARVAQFKNFFGGRVEHEYTYTYKSALFKFFEKFLALKLFILRALHHESKT